MFALSTIFLWYSSRFFVIPSSDEAISVSEKYNRGVTYQGWYSESKTGPRLA